MTFDLCTFDWNAVLAVISFLALVAVIFTLREMKRQRSYTYRPLLAIEQKQFVIQRNDGGIPTIWKDTYEHSADIYQLPFYFNLYNIGLASAHDVEINWKVDVAILEGKLKNYLNDPTQLTKNDYPGHPSNYSYHNNDNTYGFSIEGDDFIQRTALVHNHSNYQLKLPGGLQSFLSFFPVLLYKEKQQQRLEMTLDIPIKLEMKYKDLSEKTMIQNLNVKVWIYLIDGFGLNKENVLIGRFEFV